MYERQCTYCRINPAKEGIDYCDPCNDYLNKHRLAEKSLEMEKDGILTEEDMFHASDTGC